MINFRPVFFVSLSFGLGIFLSFAVGFHAYWTLLALLPVAAAVIIYRLKTKKSAFGVLLFAAVLCAFYSVGAFSFTVRISAFENDPVLAERCVFSGEVSEIGDADYRRILTLSEIELVTEEGRTLRPNSKMTLYVYGSVGGLRIGSIVRGQSEIQTYDAIAYGRLNTSAILSGVRYRASADIEDLSVTEGHALPVFSAVRSRFREVLFSSTDTSTASIAYAMLVGDSGYMDGDVLQNFRYGGIAHIFAVSGLHIGVIYGLLYGLLRRLRVKGCVRLPVVFAALLFYCGVCGFSPSSVRALVMCTVLMIADAAGYAYDRLNSVSAASLVVLVINPVYLFSVGFQLSVAAAAGIIVLGGHLGRLLARVKFLPRKFSSALSVAFSAQVCTFPLLIDCFGYVSALSLVLNLLFIPVISAVYSALFVCMIFAAVIPAAGTAVLYVPCLLLQVAVTPVMMADFGVLLISGFTFGGAAVLWYVLVFLISDKVNLKIIPKAVGSAALCVALAVCLVLQNAAVGYSAVATVHADYGGQAFILRREKYISLILFSSPDPSYLERLLLSQGITAVDDLIVLAPPREVNTAIPVVLECAEVGAVYVRQGTEFKDTFHTVEIRETDGFFYLGATPALFMDDAVLYVNFLGADILLCGEETQARLPRCDLLVAPSWSQALADACSPSGEIYFEKTEGKLSVYSAGDLQLRVKNGIIDVVAE